MSQVTTLLKLIPISPEEVELSWEDVCSNPYKLIQLVCQYVAVEGKFLSTIPGIVIQPGTPSAEDRGKLWIKTSLPYGIGIFADGAYQVDYSASNLLSNIPMLLDPNTVNPLIQGLALMTGDQITNAGITDTIATAPNRLRWYLFQPGVISI